MTASCDVVEMYEDASHQDAGDVPPTPHEETRMLFAIAARRGSDGEWRAIAWRDFRTEDPMRH